MTQQLRCRIVSRARCAILTFVFLVVAAPAIGAQSRDSIPRELVLALLGVQSRMAGAELLVGKAPASLPAEVLSPDVRVLGGFEGDQQSTTVLVVPARSDEARRQLRERLEKAGWKRPPESARPQQPSRGFVDHRGRGASRHAIAGILRHGGGLALRRQRRDDLLGKLHHGCTGACAVRLRHMGGMHRGQHPGRHARGVGRWAS